MAHRPLHRPLWAELAENEAAEDRRTASLAGVAVTLLLIVVGLFLIQHLRATVRIEDCLLSGRTNCSVLLPAIPSAAGMRPQ
ncbi:MAG: hypothetical protein JSR21_13280 [Proteobacteria bacterium]|nr:hypothetical protein [Pseudomonadota bacterium]